MQKNTLLTIFGVLVVILLGVLIFTGKDKASTDYLDQPISGHEIPTAPIENLPNSGTQFGTSVTFKAGEQVMFTDGLVVKLKEINDSRCPKDVQCIWAGEISGLFDISGGKIDTKNELRLGTENFKVQQQNGYTFSLKSATATSITIVVTYQKPVMPTGGCFIGGCSGQICSDQQDVMSTCEYREEYACYKSASCGRQSNGQCGWTQTAELKACLGN